MQLQRLLTVCLWSVVAFMALLLPVLVAADDTQQLAQEWIQEWRHKVERASLRGLIDVAVFINGFDNPAVARNGLTTAQVQTDVELRLRMAGLKVLTAQEIVALTVPPSSTIPSQLEVKVNLVKHARYPVYAVTIDVRLFQKREIPSTTIAAKLGGSTIEVPLFQKRDQDCPGDTTWDRHLLDTIDSASLYTLRETVRNVVDEFINDYLSINPRPVPVTSPPTTTPVRPSLRHDLIRQVQGRLQTAGFKPGALDGTMGLQTREALRWFQNTKGLIPTGEIDEKTLDALGLR